jgi:hypothetical protein
MTAVGPRLAMRAFVIKKQNLGQNHRHHLKSRSRKMLKKEAPFPFSLPLC